MAKEAQEQEDGKHIPTNKKLEQLYELIDGIEIAMLTSRTKTGALVSRPMQTQARRPGTDLWFMTSITSSVSDPPIWNPTLPPSTLSAIGADQLPPALRHVMKPLPYCAPTTNAPFFRLGTMIAQ